MNKFMLKGFTDDSYRSVVSIDKDALQVRFRTGGPKADKYFGFIEPTRGGVDFLLTESLDHELGTLAPDWTGRLWIFVDNRLISTDEVVRCEFRDFLVFRQFRIWLMDSTVLQKTYSPGWRDLLFPADPMFPWGRDFYKFMIQRISRKAGKSS